MVVYFGPEVEKALKNYLEVRKNIIPVEGHEHALSTLPSANELGSRPLKTWLKYARQVTTTKKITPHKLRSTYGTALYQKQAIFTCSGRFRP